MSVSSPLENEQGEAARNVTYLASKTPQEMKTVALTRLTNVYSCCTLRPSKIHGVGVFAIQDIKAGTRIPLLGERPIIVNETLLLKESVSSFREYEDVVEASQEELAHIPPSVHRALRTRYFRTKDGTQTLPLHGLNSLTLVEFLNHSGTPNLHSLLYNSCTCGLTEEEGKGKNHHETCILVRRQKGEYIDEWNEWEALTDIKEGDEIVIDYRKCFPDTYYYDVEVAPFLKK